ncbi:uncharacterized protein LOC128234391 [Mya arenaria]|uniref:uncharacterized protein LOC128234391 n=1 Tax=Mya arenaria TaxID=6604 RepID=UPI0022E3A00A|nr:uncharacterized protein LOC128234391 [Mya arenaria]XP_052804566.1 uncharacterized protein LOC128234391 [Mya arenaria]
MTAQSSVAERKIVLELTDLLQKNESKVLSGETNLCLTPSSLCILDNTFRRFSENSEDVPLTPGKNVSKARQEAEKRRWKENIRALYDFVLKVKALKIIHGSSTMRTPVKIARFQSITVLEVKKLPIHMVEGLSRVRGQLSEITVSKCLQDVKDLLEICGGDRSPGLVWSYLRNLYLSFNSLKHLDTSLRFVPFVEVLDLSHNNLTETKEYLTYLTELTRVNLGYNMLSVVPTFSSTCKHKLGTIVLRSNQLDKIDGIEELQGLQELDIADNFLLDHKCLEPLEELTRLNVLCVSGNPMCYKPQHRILTVGHLSSLCGFGAFLLDGKRLNGEEISVLKQNKYRNYQNEITNDPEQEDHDDETEVKVIAVSQHSMKKKRGHRRVPSKERIPAISNIEDSLMEQHLSGSTGATPSSSYKDRSTELSAEAEEEKKRYEIMRKHYSHDWLKALTAEKSQDLTDSSDKSKSRDEADVRAKREPSPNFRNSKNDIRTKSPVNPTSMNKPEPARVEEVIKATVNKPLTSSISPHISDTTDIYSQPVKSASKDSMKSGIASASASVLQIYSQTSVDFPTTSASTIDSGIYGEECEPFFVLLPEKNMTSLILTMNDRFLIEKDQNGHKIGSLDLKCLLTVNRREEICDGGKDQIGGLMYNVIHLTFDMVKKDARKRTYALEDENDAMSLESLLSKHIQSSDEQYNLMECLKCQKDFKQLSEESQPNSLLKCPSCGSNMVIGSSKVMTSGKTAGTLSPMQAGNGRENKPSVGDLREQGKFLQPDTKLSKSPKIRRKSPLRGKSPQRYSGSGKSFRGYDEPDSGQQVEPDKIKSESYLSTSPKESTKGNVVPNSSCSDVRISISTAYTTQESVNSVESDIAILRQNSSQSRISDSFTEATKENVSQKVSMTVSLSEKNGHVTAESDHNTQSNGVHWLEDGKGHVTPMGSPLSNSVCSSMVSSVYENTLAGGGDDKSQGGDFEVLTEESQTGSSTDSVTLRRSLGTPEQTRLRGSRNRTMAFYGSESALSQSRNNNADDSEGLKRKSENSDIERKETKSNREFSIYESDSNRNATSIYDSAVSEQDSMGVDQNNSSVYLDTNNSNIYSENDQSSNISSPVIRRNKTSQRSQVKRQAGKFYDELSEGLQDFPSDLSPIKNSARKPKDAYIENEGTDLEKSTEALSEYSSATSQSKADDSLQTTGSLNTTGSAMLPWEIEVNKTKDSGKNESLNHDEFINIDHRAQLYLELRVFKAEETAQCAIQCAIVQYMKPKDIKSLLVISTSRILIFEITGDSSSGSDWLKCYEDQPITELHYIDIGLGYQSLRLEFDTECASYTLLIADEGKCKKFLTLISDIVQTAALSDHSKLEGIIKRNPATLSNLESQVLTFDVDPDPEGDPQTLVRYLAARLIDEESEKGELINLVVTPTDIVMVEENHQWPLPRLQAPLSDNLKGRQFTIIQREKINNIESLMYNEENPTELKVTFFETSDTDNGKSEWLISLETGSGVKSLVDSIRDPWESEFGVSLDITSTSFSEPE